MIHHHYKTKYNQLASRDSLNALLNTSSPWTNVGCSLHKRASLLPGQSLPNCQCWKPAQPFELRIAVAHQIGAKTFENM